MNYTLEYIRKNNLIIFESIMGSKAYGTSLPTSDTDIRGIFIQPLEDVLKYGYIEQISDEKNDVIFYELKRFMDLLKNNNPNIMELLNAPEDCIILQTGWSKALTENRHRFLSKLCKNTFGGYAVQQIKKARGLNKKINWEESEITRKTVLDFCYVIQEDQTIKFNEWLNVYDVCNDCESTQKGFALSKLDHARDLYSLYDMFDSNMQVEGPLPEFKFYGIVKDEEKSNDVQLFSIPRGKSPVATLIFNKDAYSIHCKNYAEYKEWLEKRNDDRFKMNKEHGKQYDSKNMMHTFRLLKMASEIAQLNEINVRRSDEEIKELMSIRRGEMEYEDMLKKAEEILKSMDELFLTSSLPESPDQNYIRDIQYSIRKDFYEENKDECLCNGIDGYYIQYDLTGSLMMNCPKCKPNK